MMEFVNGAQKWEGQPPLAAVEPFVLLLSPYAPHLAEELWQVSVHTQILYASQLATCQTLETQTSRSWLRVIRRALLADSTNLTP